MCTDQKTTECTRCEHKCSSEKKKETGRHFKGRIQQEIRYQCGYMNIRMQHKCSRRRETLTLYSWRVSRVSELYYHSCV